VRGSKSEVPFKLVAAGCTVVGVDASAEMTRAARGLGIDAQVIDAQSLTFRSEFDAVFTNAALHWM
jgi:trans-aconitate methyltransferase